MVSRLNVVSRMTDRKDSGYSVRGQEGLSPLLRFDRAPAVNEKVFVYA